MTIQKIRRTIARALASAEARDGMAMQRLLSERAAMTGGRGFRTPPKEPKRDAQGKTRGDRKREARAAANAKIAEEQRLRREREDELSRKVYESQMRLWQHFGRSVGIPANPGGTGV